MQARGLAATPPDPPLERGEFTEVVLRGALRDPGGPGSCRILRALLRRAPRLRRWVILTNHRLLLLRRRDPKRYQAREWYDASFDRRALRASTPFLEGSLVVVALVTSKGPASLLLPERSLPEARRMARALARNGSMT